MPLISYITFITQKYCQLKVECYYPVLSLVFGKISLTQIPRHKKNPEFKCTENSNAVRCSTRTGNIK